MFSFVPERIRNWYAPKRALANEYQFARFLLIRLLGLCFTFVFLGYVQQAPGLIGENGILPIERYRSFLLQNFGDVLSLFWEMPSIFWFNYSDGYLVTAGWVGLILSLAVLCGYANSLMLFILWALQLSIVYTGQLFWSYGWETQLLETSFLAMFLVPLLDGRPFPKSRSSRIVILLFCWLIIRIMLGAGLIKLRGDASWNWTELSALFYHFETQPIPNGLSWYFHHLPKFWLQAGVAINHVVELFLPALLLLPRRFRNGAGAGMILFQLTLIVSGNLSFLNHVTIIPCLACIDDRFYRKCLPKRWWAKIRESNPPQILNRLGKVTLGTRIALLLLVAYLSIAPVTNLFSPNQRMNSSFDRLHLVNTYGAFGSVGKERFEIVVEGTDSLFKSSNDTEWREYQFHGKPGDPQRLPPSYTPYHHRLDWEIWFAAFGSMKGELWPAYFAFRLLQNEPAVVSLLRENPFPDEPPNFVRLIRYRYRFTTPEEHAKTGAWWVKEKEGVFFGPVGLWDSELNNLLDRARWPEGI